MDRHGQTVGRVYPRAIVGPNYESSLAIKIGSDQVDQLTVAVNFAGNKIHLQAAHCEMGGG